MDEDGFIEKKNTKKSSQTQRRALKKKYREPFETHWKQMKVEYEITANEKYDKAKKDTMGESDYDAKKKIAINAAMKKLDEKKDKIFEDYINNRFADEQFLEDIAENETEPKKLPEVEKKNYISRSIFDNLEIE